VGVIERCLLRLLARPSEGVVRGKLRNLGLAAVVTVVIMLMVAVATAGTDLVARLNVNPTAIRLAVPLISLALTTLLCGAVFRALAGESLRWRAAWAGAAVSAVILNITPTAAGYYLRLVSGRTPVELFLMLAGVLFTCYLAAFGLLLGTNTAGKATMGKEFTLNNGQHLWIATALVKLGDGKTFPATGLRPDIQVEVSPADERAYFEDAYKMLPNANRLATTPTNQTNLSVTNRLPRHRPSEADLVRMHRDGELPDFDTPLPKTRETELPPRVIYDPALARAIDLLKGLSVVQQFRAI
jgi:hypothetical protein